MTRLRHCLLIVFSVAVTSAVASGARPPSELEAAKDPEAQCRSIQGEDFTGLEDAPTQVTESLILPTGDKSTLCRVRGYVSPQVGFELQLPTPTWNGKFVEVGCSGKCGVIDTLACVEPVHKGYACIASDMGHKGTSADGQWAYNNLQAKIDYAYRATHVVALAGKALAAHYYRRAPGRSYFTGCSNGGRQGMIEAQRFPWDFDGIVAGAPPMNLAPLNQVWFSLSALDKDGRSVLKPADVQLLHKAVLDRCDADDGIKDGIVGNPLACKFDPAILACRAGRTDNCLTQTKLTAVQKIYSGPVTNQSGVYSGGEMPGSELGWVGPYFSTDGQPGSLYQYGSEGLRYLSYLPDAGPSWQPENLDFDHDYARVAMIQSLMAPTNPDLRQFQRAGGKLLMYQGWNDQLEVPKAAIDYYETAQRVIGNRAETQQFFRLFLIPGMGHCGGGDGADVIDYLTYLEAWVEQGRAPDALVGAHVDVAGFIKTHDPHREDFAAELESFRHDPSNIQFTRPVYPYPTRPQYSGQGDPRDAKSFFPAPPN
jgi:hypothetical protein